MQRLLALLAALLLPSLAWADSTVHGLSTSTTSPLPANSCLYVDQGPGTDTKLCSGYAAALGALAATAAAGGDLGGNYPNPTVVSGAHLTGTLASGLTLPSPIITTAFTATGLVTYADIVNGTGNHLLRSNTGAAPSEMSEGTGVFAALGNALNSGTGLIGNLTPTNNNCAVGNGSAWTSAACPGGGSVSITAGTPNIVVTPSPLTGTGTVGTTNAQNTPTDSGTHTYAPVSGDLTKEVILVSTFTAVTPPQATSTFGAGASFNLVTKGAVTATPTTSTANGLASIKLGANQFSEWDSDGTNYLVGLGVPQPTTQTGTTFLRDDMTWAAPAGAGTVTQNGNLTTHAPVIGGTNGTSDVKTTAAMTDSQVLIGATGADPVPHAMSQDCTMTTAGVVTCLKTNNVAFTSAATTAIGTSGATIPLLNGANTWSGVQTFGNVDLAITDASAAHNVLIEPNSSTALTADRILTIDVVNAARTLKIGANLTIATDPGAVSGIVKSNGTGTFAAATATDIPAETFATGTTHTFAAPSEIWECTGTCTVTLPTPAAGYQFCVRNANNVTTIITVAVGGSVLLENTNFTSYKSAGTSIASAGAAGDKVCYVGKDSTHYDVFAFNGTWS